MLEPVVILDVMGITDLAVRHRILTLMEKMLIALAAEGAGGTETLHAVKVMGVMLTHSLEKLDPSDRDKAYLVDRGAMQRRVGLVMVGDDEISIPSSRVHKQPKGVM